MPFIGPNRKPNIKKVGFGQFGEILKKLNFEAAEGFKNHLGGCSVLLRFRARTGRKLPGWWQTKARKYSPDAQDSKKCWVGYLPGTLWGSAGPESKISKPL